MCIVIILCIIMVSSLCVHYIYYRSTKFNHKIFVTKKYKTNKDNIKSLHIIDNDGNCYKIGSCLWELKWNADKIWKRIIEQKKYHICGYGKKMEQFGTELIIYELY